MLIVLGTLLLLFSACAMLYQADARRGALAVVRRSSRARTGLRLAAMFLMLVSLVLLAELQGWERGIPIWLGLFSFVFVAGLFLSSQKPHWHGPVGVASLAIGAVLATGGVVT